MSVITVDDLKAHLNQTLDDDDDLIAGKIAAAEAYLEGFTGKAFLTQSVTDVFDCFSRTMRLSRGPVREIEEVTYLDTSLVEQTLAPEAYGASPLNVDRTAYLYSAPNQSWPRAARVPGAIKVTYTAGYGTAADVPDAIKEAVRQLAAHLYENREATLVGVNAQDLPFGVLDLVSSHREFAF